MGGAQRAFSCPGGGGMVWYGVVWCHTRATAADLEENR